MIGSREQQAEVRGRKRSQRHFFVGLFFVAVALMVLIVWTAMKVPVEPEGADKMRAGEKNQLTRSTAPGSSDADSHIPGETPGVPAAEPKK